MKTAFTMIELIFVIVILGILAAVALPKFGNTKEQADLANARAEIASIRSGIVSERQTRLIQGNSSWITDTNLDSGNGLFTGVLMYGLANKNENGNWYTATEGNGEYDYKINNLTIKFDYNDSSGIFTCNANSGNSAVDDYCKSLIQ